MRHRLADKGYDADWLRPSVRDGGAVPAIFGRRNRKKVIHHDKQCYRGRHLIENASCRLKNFRRVDTVTTSWPPTSFQTSRSPSDRDPA